MQNIGLMMTCNEEDCIKEVMDEHVKYFDEILVLDGSSDRTEEILRGYPQVKYFIKDQEIINKLPNHKFKDGARQFILAKAQEMYGYDGWFTLLHGDEIFYDNPIEMAKRAEKERAEKINWYVMDFFLHTSDKGKDLDAIRSIQQRVTWYCPGFLEIRSFKNKKGIYYDLCQAGVLPRRVGIKPFSKFPVYKHYPFRSVDQILKKKKQRQLTDLSPTYNNISDYDSCFRDILPGFKVARKFDGSFHEFEIDKQGSMFWRWFRGYRYQPIKIGNPFA